MKKRIQRIKRDPLINKLRATKITPEQFLSRHSHCVSVRSVQQAIDRSHSDHISYGLGVPHLMKGTDFTPKDIRAVCDFPMDGVCGQNIPSQEQMDKINARLGGKPLKEYIEGKITLSEMNDALSLEGEGEEVEMTLEDIAEIQRQALEKPFKMLKTPKKQVVELAPPGKLTLKLKG